MMPAADDATSLRARRIAADYRDLRETADRCDALAAAVDNSRAHRLLALLAVRARGVLAVIDAEPGPAHLPRPSPVRQGGRPAR